MAKRRTVSQQAYYQIRCMIAPRRVVARQFAGLALISWQAQGEPHAGGRGNSTFGAGWVVTVVPKWGASVKEWTRRAVGSLLYPPGPLGEAARLFVMRASHRRG